MVKLVLVRHGNKLHESTRRHYDSPIDKQEWNRGEVLFQEYINEHNIIPTKILCSPYLRTRETASILSRVTGLDVEIVRGFSNYIGPSKIFDEDSFDEDTWAYKPCSPESRYHFRNRVYNAYHDVLDSYDKDDIVWIITHRFVISTCVNIVDKDDRRSFKPLSGVIIDGNDLTWLDG